MKMFGLWVILSIVLNVELVEQDSKSAEGDVNTVAVSVSVTKTKGEERAMNEVLLVVSKLLQGMTPGQIESLIRNKDRLEIGLRSELGAVAAYRPPQK